MSKITVHHLEYSRSVRILWLLEELGVTYQITRYARDPRTFRAGPELAAVHPLGRAPMVTVDDEVLVESGAIIEYFADRHPTLRPTDPKELQEYRFWLHYAEGSVMPPLLVRLITGRIRHAKVPFFLKPVTRRIADQIDGNYTNGEVERHARFIDKTLAERPWFVGDAFTAADVQMVYPVDALLERGGVAGLPHIRAWKERVSARPAYQRALEAGGPSMPPR